MHFYFFGELLLITVFTFNLRVLYEVKYKVHFSKIVCVMFHFWFHLVFIKAYIFLQEKAWPLWI